MQDILSQIARDPNVAPAFVAAISPTRAVHTRAGNGGLISVTGPSRAAVEARAQEEAARYPGYAYGTDIGAAQQASDGEWSAVVRWFAAD